MFWQRRRWPARAECRSARRTVVRCTTVLATASTVRAASASRVTSSPSSGRTVRPAPSSRIRERSSSPASLPTVSSALLIAVHFARIASRFCCDLSGWIVCRSDFVFEQKKRDSSQTGLESGGALLAVPCPCVRFFLTPMHALKMKARDRRERSYWLLTWLCPGARADFRHWLDDVSVVLFSGSLSARSGVHRPVRQQLPVLGRRLPVHPESVQVGPGHRDAHGVPRKRPAAPEEGKTCLLSQRHRQNTARRWFEVHYRLFCVCKW